jgi:hypothetical protein
MCDPVSIGAGAALAGGTVMSGMGRNQANKAAGRAMSAEAGRQRGYRDAAAGAWNKGLDKIERPATEQGLKDAQSKRTGAFQKNVTNFSAIPADGRSNEPKVIADAYAGANKASTDYGLNYGARTGALEGYGDQLYGRSVDIGRTRQDIDQQGNYSRGSMSVLPVELEGASTKGSTLRSIGEIFQGLGNLGLMYAFTKAPTAAGPNITAAGVRNSAGTIPGIGSMRIG